MHMEEQAILYVSVHSFNVIFFETNTKVQVFFYGWL